jgi:hypothetical protein
MFVDRLVNFFRDARATHPLGTGLMVNPVQFVGDVEEAGSWVVSANYLDRDNGGRRWLARRSNVPMAEIERDGRPTVYARDVEFHESSTYETGFGCMLVAFAEELLTEPRIVELERLTFIFSGFVTASGNYVWKCEYLELRADGSIWVAGIVDV